MLSLHRKWAEISKLPTFTKWLPGEHPRLGALRWLLEYYNNSDYTIQKWCRKSRSMVTSQQLLCVTLNSTLIFRRPSSLHLDRSRDVFPLGPVNRLSSPRLTSRSETPSFSHAIECAWLCETRINSSQRKRLGLYLGFLRLDEITIRVTIRQS